MSQGALEKSFKCATCDKWIRDIVMLIDHAASNCDEILHLDALSKREKSTLMYIESRIVDGMATLNRSQMNHEDDQNIKLFAAAGLIDVQDSRDPTTKDLQMEVTKFTDEAWQLAADCRKERGEQNL